MNAAMERLQDELRNRGAHYEVIEHPAAHTAQEAAAAGHIPGHMFLKTVVGMVNEQPVVFALQATREIDFAALRSVLGVEAVRMARKEELAGIVPDCEPGALPPVPGPNALPVYLDGAVLGTSEIAFAVGSPEAAIRLSLDDYRQLVSPRVIDFSRAPANEQPRRVQARRPRRWWRLLATTAGGAAALIGGRFALSGARRWPLPATLAGGAVLGAAGAALLDPHSGARRRALVRDKGWHYVRQLGRSTRSAGVRAVHRTGGVGSQLRGRGHPRRSSTP
ncbi:MAG: YbaK/EbsC family protein [Dehalococcoidia bacterium]